MRAGSYARAALKACGAPTGFLRSSHGSRGVLDPTVAAHSPAMAALRALAQLEVGRSIASFAGDDEIAKLYLAASARALHWAAEELAASSNSYIVWIDWRWRNIIIIPAEQERQRGVFAF